MEKKETIRRGYDELAETYAARCSKSGREMAILDQFLDSLSEPTRILDAGCGQGVPILQRLCEKAAAVGLDSSREQLQLAAETVSPALLVLGDMTMLPFRDGVFDAVMAYHSVIHVPLADHQTVLDEFARVLSPGGHVLLSESPAEFEPTNTDWLDNAVEMTWSMAGSETTREQLQNAGFRMITEWEAPDTSTEDDPKALFFAARLDT